METLKAGGRCGIVLDEGLLFQTNQAAFVQTKRRLLDTCDLWCVVSLPAGVFSATGAGVKTNLLFFTKGRPTKSIWYYDLSDVKVGKKTPFTRDKLAEFFKLLPHRGDSDRSWAVDIAERRRKAKQDADAIRAAANEPKGRLRQELEALDRLKSAKADSAQQAVLKERIKEAEREIREIEAKAQTVEDAAFDLKAINPHAKADEDTRTPAQLLEFIAAKNEELRGILARLQAGAAVGD
jgi:type I restriction enzyme M protein